MPLAEAWEIVVETEPEFDDAEREAWEALAEWRAAICPHCGNLRVICSNPEGIDGSGVYPQLDYCWITAAVDKSTRRFHKLHAKAEPDAAGYLPTDGALISASLTNDSPDDDFLADGIPAEILDRTTGNGDSVAE